MHTLSTENFRNVNISHPVDMKRLLMTSAEILQGDVILVEYDLHATLNKWI